MEIIQIKIITNALKKIVTVKAVYAKTVIAKMIVKAANVVNAVTTTKHAINPTIVKLVKTSLSVKEKDVVVEIIANANLIKCCS